MPLHPRIEALLRATAHLPRPPVVPVDVARRSFRDRTRLLPAATEVLDTIEDVVLPGPAGELRARLYRPTGAAPRPLLLFFHGGGFALGDLDTHDGLCRRLAARGPFVVLALDYRLAPEHPFPAAPDDCWAAICWAAAEGRALGSDGSLLLAGDSAGGTLALATALRCRDQSGPSIRAQALLYPALAHYTAATSSYSEMAMGYGLTRDSMIWFWDQYLADARHRLHPYAVPAESYSFMGLPPTLVITAEYDVLRDEAEQFAAALPAAGVTACTRRFPGMHHGFAGLAGWIEEADEALLEVCDWLRGRA